MNGSLKSLLRTEWLSLLAVVVLLVAALSIFTEQFDVEFNLYVLVFNIALATLVAYGQMVVVATGGMNIALGATGGLSAVIMASLMESYGVPLPLVIVVGLLAGTGMGFINGLLTVKTGINPFVITLAMASAYTGANMAITSANPYYNIDPTLVAWGQARSVVFPYPAIVTVVVAVLLGVLFYRMALGRQILAVGGNSRAAELTGVPVGRVIIAAHVLSGFLAGLAGLLTMARLGNGTPTIGSDWLLPGFAAIIIGGAALEGGKVAIVGVVLGVTILELITNALAINRIDPYWVTLFQGSLILFFVGLSQLRNAAGGTRLTRRPPRQATLSTRRDVMEQEPTVLAPQPDSAAPQADPLADPPGPPALLEMRGIRKAFPGVQALDGVSLTLHAGEVLALIGENGAGKSTLIKVLTGLYRPEEGQILLEGKEVRFGSPREAYASGIAHVPQERNLIPRFSAGENIMLEALPRRGAFIDYDTVNKEAQKWLDLLDVSVDPRTPVSDLSVAQMQLVEIARAISREGRILLLDEPTASITPTETRVLFEVLRRLRDQGVGIIFVSHKLEEVFELCDTIGVLRDGKNAGPQAQVAEMDRDKVVTLMVGRAQVTHELPARTAGHGGPILELQNVTTSSGATNVSLTLHRGEILGLYGLVGAGRSELARSIIGVDKVLSGTVLVDGRPAHIRNVGDALDRYGIGYVSENRKEEGLIQIHSVISNVSITIWQRLQNALGWVGGRLERATVAPFVEKLDIKTPSLATPVGSLSGGNQQKVALAKWLTARVKVLIVDEPTVGIDVRTKANLHELIWDLASQGLAIMLISSDMPEVVRLADRIVVMRAGRIAGELENNHDYAEESQRIMGFIH